MRNRGKPQASLFVYGLLRPDAVPEGGPAEVRLADDYGPATTSATLYDVSGNFPAAVRGGGTLHGRLLHWPGGIDWRGLDAFEGCDETPPLFRRARTIVHWNEGDIEAWIYWWARETDHLKAIPSGRWEKR